jgi:hypothetical protein
VWNGRKLVYKVRMGSGKREQGSGKESEGRRKKIVKVN